jgi:hypothetical protein
MHFAGCRYNSKNIFDSFILFRKCEGINSLQLFIKFKCLTKIWAQWVQKCWAKLWIFVFSTYCAFSREYWMIYRAPSFLAVVWFGSSPTPFPIPFPSASCLSFSVFLCVAGRACWRERGRARGAKSYDHRESLALYKLFTTLWCTV